MERSSICLSICLSVSSSRTSVAKLDNLWHQQSKYDFPKSKQGEEFEKTSKGYAVKVPPEELAQDDGKLWYIPHHGVNIMFLVDETHGRR